MSGRNKQRGSYPPEPGFLCALEEEITRVVTNLGLPRLTDSGLLHTFLIVATEQWVDVRVYLRVGEFLVLRCFRTDYKKRRRSSLRFHVNNGLQAWQKGELLPPIAHAFAAILSLIPQDAVVKSLMREMDYPLCHLRDDLAAEILTNHGDKVPAWLRTWVFLQLGNDGHSPSGVPERVVATVPSDLVCRT